MMDDVVLFVCFKQKTAYEMRISDWSSDVCSSDLAPPRARDAARVDAPMTVETPVLDREEGACDMFRQLLRLDRRIDDRAGARDRGAVGGEQGDLRRRDRLERFRQRRGEREPADEQEEEDAEDSKTARSEERRVGKEWVRQGRSRWAP